MGVLVPNIQDSRARLAAIGDLHVKGTLTENLVTVLRSLPDRVDALVIAGDITDGGRLIEVEAAAEILGTVDVPVIAVLGNHDRRCLRPAAFRRALLQARVHLLDGNSLVLRNQQGIRIGFAGIGGAGGGFWPIEGPDMLHYRATQALSLKARKEALRLDSALASLDADLRVVVTHFAPTTSTLGNEPLLKYWMLGNSELGRVIDRYPVDLVLHGHAHLGNPLGSTIGGIMVKNVASAVNGGLVIHDFRVDDASMTSSLLTTRADRD